jgi:hypothetical protein
MASGSVLRVERVAVALVGTGVGAVLLFALLVGLGAGEVVAAGIATACAVGTALALAGHLPSELDGTLRQHALLGVLWFAIGLATIGATARLATFMVDERRVDRSIFPFDEFYVHHSCLSAHYESARLQRNGVANVYERTNFEGPRGEPRFLRSFVIDVFIYPPPFLLLSRLGLALSEDFAVWRAVWFGLEGAIVATGLLSVAYAARGRVRSRALLVLPLVWLSLPLLTTLQFGNFHLVAISGSILAMLALERGHHSLGGALLAALAVGKVFPGILVLLLLLQRRWRSLAWTAAFGMLFLGLAWFVLGEAPFRAMIAYNLPRLSSGAALETQFVHPDAIAASHAIFGLIQKLELLGVPGASQRVAVAASWLYTGALVFLAALGARAQSSEPLSRALVWLALLQLASLRSPFTPDTYALFPVLWMLVLLLANADWRSWRAGGLLGLVVLANYLVPTVPIMPLPALLTLGLLLQVLFLSLCIGILVAEARRGVEAPAPALAG